MQHFIDQKGNVTSMAKNRQSMSQYYDQWCYGSELTVQSKDFKNHRLFFLNPYKIYPAKNILPIIKRNGFKGKFHDISPQDLFTAILSDSNAETLLKTNQIDTLNYYITKHKTSVSNNWSSIKICSKNGYIIKDFSLWKDYIDLLKQFNKDVHNPKYICPADLNKAHDKLVEKKRKIQLKEKISEMKENLKTYQKKYSETKKSYFGLSFSDGNITIKVLESVKDFLVEGETHGHCVFTNEYFNKTDSLILSASLNDVKLETIEISLETLKIIQSRGTKNKATKYNGKIIDLVNRNMHKIDAITKQAC